MDYITFCKNYYTVTNIPANLLKGETPIFSSLAERLGEEPTNDGKVFWEDSNTKANPVFCRYSPDIEYGCVHVEGTDYYIVLGPTFSIPVSDELVRLFMHENAIPLKHRETVAEFLCTIPLLSHQQFASHLALIHLSLNHKETKLEEYLEPDEQQTQKREEEHVHKIIDNIENENLHNSYKFEQDLYQHIKNGDVNRLESFLESTPLEISEGKLANTPLRHAKNLFILTVAKIGMLGAIPGGVNVEKAYQLMDLYIQECEQQQTIEAVKALQYAMLKDFCRQAGDTHIPEGISAEVYQCINYIRSHTNESISIDDVARQVHRSTSYIMKLFKKELGINMGAFITRCKLEEAKSLLAYTDKSLADISSYLCFSSQSYFQNVFKKKYNVTPMQYRSKSRKL